MSNVKRVEIKGKAPYNLHENETLQPMLAFMAGPMSGLKIEWKGFADSVPAPPPNSNGCIVCYNFELTGEEAVSYKWLDLFVDTLNGMTGGEVTTNKVRDIENDG